MTVAALFVAEGGAYYGLEDVDPWPESRDARKYAGPWPVVAHPPCQLWVNFAALNFKRYGGEHNRPGNDGGCFASALSSVRKFGGVLEHPASSMAWAEFGIDRPVPGRWIQGRAYSARAGRSRLVAQGRDTSSRLVRPQEADARKEGGDLHPASVPRPAAFHRPELRMTLDTIPGSITRPDPLELENDRLRASIEGITATLDATVAAFAREREALRAEVERLKKGEASALEAAEMFGNLSCAVAFDFERRQIHNREYACCAYCLQQPIRVGPDLVAHMASCPKHPVATLTAERDAARLAVEIERELCAQVASAAPHRFGCEGGATERLAEDIAAAIRARGAK